MELYKPTGPDGLGWGEFRQESELELKITYPEKYNHDSIPNEIEWEQKFIKIVNKEQDKLIANSKKLSKVKREKKERMNKRKEKAVKDSERRKQEHANKLKDIYLSYGIYKIEKSSENVQDIIMPSKKLKEKEEEI